METELEKLEARIESDIAQIKAHPCATCSNLQKQINVFRHDQKKTITSNSLRISGYFDALSEAKSVVSIPNDDFESRIGNIENYFGSLLVENQVDFPTPAPPKQWPQTMIATLPIPHLEVVSTSMTPAKFPPPWMSIVWWQTRSL